MNKKASIFDLIIWIVVAFIAVLFLGIWVYGHNILTTTLADVSGSLNTDIVNVTSAAEDSFGVANNAMSILHFVAIALIVSMAIAILISNFLVKANPVFFGLYLLVTIVSIILAAFVSNAYETLLSNNVFGSTLGEFRAATFVMLNLPVWTTVIGIFGAILLFIGITRDRETEGSIPF